MFKVLRAYPILVGAAGVKRLVSKSVIGNVSGPCSAANPAGYPYFEEILTAIERQLTAMLSYHSRILMVRLDFHLSAYSPCSSEMSRFVDKIRKHLKGPYGLTRVGYVWVREQERAISQHYHMALLLDGNKINHPGKLITWIDQHWQARGQPKVFVPKNCFLLVRRGDDPALNAAFKRMSYFAKKRGKGRKPAGAKDYSASRHVPRKPKVLVAPMEGGIDTVPREMHGKRVG